MPNNNKNLWQFLEGVPPLVHTCPEGFRRGTHKSRTEDVDVSMSEYFSKGSGKSALNPLPWIFVSPGEI
jgi:hypothetical protein